MMTFALYEKRKLPINKACCLPKLTDVTWKWLPLSLWGQRRHWNNKIAHSSPVFISYVHLHCLLLRMQACCHLLVGRVANKIQGNFHSEECQEGRIKRKEGGGGLERGRRQI